MKKIFYISLVIWIIFINIGKIWPISKGERYYRNLQKWYLLANKGEWEKAKKIESKLRIEDIEYFTKENKEEELKRKLNQIIIKNTKSVDDWMEIAATYYRLNNRDKAFEAIESAYKLDPIREDVSKIYFTFRSSPPPPAQP